ncbi:MAG TPA: Maf family protein [Sphaerochaeta sp.]|nr:Maf family protein [Sphaerochaeta sp.]HPB42402.1 Maf family protein [Sphaerochaeta sp.]HPY46101.1 Maf family protein [Sphaerochaeta sp.]HQB05401.1 Maf family protein [Sphaerochaeta sp.]
MSKTIILASKSLGRKLLLEEAGFEVLIQPSKADEEHQRESVEKSVRLLAMRKLEAFLRDRPSPTHPVIASDTLLAFEEIELGQPETREAAFSQLRLLSGATHHVYSAWALWVNGDVHQGCDRCAVTFKELSDDEIEAYLDTGEWVGAAGSYRYQGRGKELVRSTTGDESTVIGLPMNQIFGILAKALPDW